MLRCTVHFDSVPRGNFTVQQGGGEFKLQVVPVKSGQGHGITG